MVADITDSDFGSIHLLHTRTEAGREWVEENIGKDNGYQPYYPHAVVVECRYVGDIVEGMRADGLEVDA